MCVCVCVEWVLGVCVGRSGRYTNFGAGNFLERIFHMIMITRALKC